MIAGHVAMRPVDVDTWHLVDMGQPGFPLVTRCGQVAPHPMERQVKAARHLAVDDVCGSCLTAAAGGGAGSRSIEQLRGA